MEGVVFFKYNSFIFNNRCPVRIIWPLIPKSGADGSGGLNINIGFVKSLRTGH